MDETENILNKFDVALKILENEKLVNSINCAGTSSSLRDKILLLDIDINTKAEIIRKLENCAGDSKILQWVDNVSKIPFGKFSLVSTKKVSTTLKRVKTQLDSVNYGNENVKEEILEFVAKIIHNPMSRGNVLALEGERGTGKTRIIKKGLSKSLNRPFFSINFGGMKDTSMLLGHSSTYMGSKYGLIADILIKGKCMNPIIYLDEIDKIGNSNSASEIYGVLTHLLDESQNYEFFDNYFDNIKLDLSKVLFVISYNNRELLDNIARDRMKIIKIKSPSVDEKIEICKQHIIPEVMRDVKMSKYIFPDDVIRHTIEKKTNEPGTRRLKRVIESVLEKINLVNQLKGVELVTYQTFINPKNKVITREMIDKLIPDDDTLADHFNNFMYT